MTTLTDTQVITASGGLVELGYSQRTTPLSVTGAFASQTDTGLSVTAVCDGSPVLVEFFSPSVNVGNTAGDQAIIEFWYDGSDYGYMAGNYVANANNSQSVCMYGTRRMTPTAGSHTFAIKAWRGTNTATINAGNGTSVDWGPTFLRVSKIVQATQWPAVTTGTIICTSSTRPASPFEGQTIYETDTDLRYTYSGSDWVMDGGLGAWTSWTPSLTATTTNPNRGTTGTASGRYMRMGSSIFFNLTMNASGTGISAGSGEYRLSLPPFNSADTLVTANGWVYDGTFYIVSADTVSSTLMRLIASTGGQISATNRQVTSGWTLSLNGFYRTT